MDAESLDAATAAPSRPSPPARSQSAPAAESLSRPPHFSWNPADAAHLGPSQITITRLYQRTTKSPYHRLESQIKPLVQPLPRSPGPQKKKRCTALDAAPTPFRPTDTASDISDDDNDDHAAPTLLQDLRSSSAPPEDTNMTATAPVPTICDDTAILRAFLSRAAASKRPIPASKRESLENRRDSDVVRQALASTDKPEILVELDPNNPPSPSTPVSPTTDAEPETSKALPVVEPPAATPAKTKTPRRTTRTRTPAASQPKPAKIAIRSAADHVALKRTEAQELALLTRSNTRKNKGKSVMPPTRLQKIAHEDVAVDDAVDMNASTDRNNERASSRRGVQWDQTLAYYQVFQPDLPDTPPDKPKSRQTRVSARAMEPLAPAAIEEPVAEASTAAELDAAETVIHQPGQDATSPPEHRPPARPAPNKRKSRIATPARPSKLPAIKPDRSAALAPLAPLKPASQAEAQENRLGTPKKPPTPFLGIKPTSLSSRFEFPPKQDAVPPAVTDTVLPGLSSPAKKRARTALGKPAVRPAQKDSELPGLTSPAKRKRVGVKFS